MFLFHFTWFVFTGLIRVFAIIIAGVMILNATDNAMDEARSQFAGVKLESLEHVGRTYAHSMGSRVQGHLSAWRQEVSRNNLRSIKHTYRF